MAAPTAKLAQLWTARELLDNLFRKELKVRYKGSFLGLAWSLVTPLLMTGIFTVVFANFLRIGVEDFASFFLAGYLAWQFFSNSVNASVGAIVGNGPLIRKVYFPREVIPLSLVGSQAVHLLIALVATAPLFLLQRGVGVLAHLPALLVGIVLLSLFTAGMSMIFAAANVGFRDLQELVQVIFLAWFYATPVIYPFFFVVNNGSAFLPIINLNPMTWYVRLFQSALYGVPLNAEQSLPPAWPSPTTWAVCALSAGATLTVGYWLFSRLAVTFAKEV